MRVHLERVAVAVGLLAALGFAFASLSSLDRIAGAAGSMIVAAIVARLLARLARRREHASRLVDAAHAARLDYLEREAAADPLLAWTTMRL